ncbi:MAG: Gfo/Idh/MocA family oxidoreductase [Candidatus Omnitrophica bacterium]|nr:Gfo/Idh/MocA family oxidoreductase [Candidatus Omnitrophota bacterium]
MAKRSHKIRVGVIGIGHLGSIHTRIYSELPGAELVAVCDADSARAEEAAKKYSCAAFTQYHKMLGYVDAVSVAVPTQHHYRIAKVCLEHGIHVLVEKPITQRLSQADELLKLARSKRRLLQVGHVERFNSAVQAFRKVAKHPRFIECHRLAPFNVRGTEVGVVLDLMIHDIDIVLGLVESPVNAIRAAGLSVISAQEDIANVRLEFRNGATANLTASRISDTATRKIRIFQTDAYISLDYAQQDALVYRVSKGQIVRSQLPIKREEPLAKELGEFIDCIRRSACGLTSARQAREALSIALQIQTRIRRQRL